MGLFGEIAGGLLDVGGAALSMFGGPVGAAIGSPVSGLGKELFTNSLNQSNVAQAESYNSPSAIMARYKAAGLNPDLIYTQGTTYMAPPVTTGTVSNPDNTTGIQYRQQKANVDNTRAMIQTASYEQSLKKAQELLTSTQATHQDMQNDLFSQTFPEQVTAASLLNDKTAADIAKTKADTTFTIDANQRAQLMNPALFQSVMTNILLSQTHNTLMKQQIISAATQNALSDLGKTYGGMSEQQQDNILQMLISKATTMLPEAP